MVSVDDLRKGIQAENDFFATLSQQIHKTGKYGGWIEGPRLEATGRFRTEKYQGKWWLVDPEGYLFWSHGSTGIGISGGFTLAKKNRFENLLPNKGETAQFYKTKKKSLLFSYYQYNLYRKYGEGWKGIASEKVYDRLKSISLNTIAGFSSEDFYHHKRVPYTPIIYANWGDPVIEDLNEYREKVRSRIEKNLKLYAEDPMCIGVFIDNEIHWSNSKTKRYAEDYYRIVREEFKKIAPDLLYLGSRIHNAPQEVINICGKYADIYSYNLYRHDPGSNVDLKLKDIDKPVIISEYHFGNLSDGGLGPGLVWAQDGYQQARLYQDYVTQALLHPKIVGTHWFQFIDQSIAGRNRDGENFQIGMFDIADQPHKELIEAVNSVGHQIYEIRIKGMDPW